MPKSQQTIKCYAKEGRWYEKLSEEIKFDQGICKDEYLKDLENGTETLNEEKEANVAIDDDSDDIEKLKKVKNVIYQFLIPNPSGKMEGLELKPKTYSEAVKCYLDIDSRINDKKSKSSNSGFNAWEEIMRRCMSSPVPPITFRRATEEQSNGRTELGE
ncbi:MAG: hypothetical protein QG641_2047 [Candidatus Poribacteria bacterium]|nr:hypothetical protein [Candidatus Poribacteria bacterium]